MQRASPELQPRSLAEVAVPGTAVLSSNSHSRAGFDAFPVQPSPDSPGRTGTGLGVSPSAGSACRQGGVTAVLPAPPYRGQKEHSPKNGLCTQKPSPDTHLGSRTVSPCHLFWCPHWRGGTGTEQAQGCVALVFCLAWGKMGLFPPGVLPLHFWQPFSLQM